MIISILIHIHLSILHLLMCYAPHQFSNYLFYKTYRKCIQFFYLSIHLTKRHCAPVTSILNLYTPSPPIIHIYIDFSSPTRAYIHPQAYPYPSCIHTIPKCSPSTCLNHTTLTSHPTQLIILIFSISTKHTHSTCFCLCASHQHNQPYNTITPYFFQVLYSSAMPTHNT